MTERTANEDRRAEMDSGIHTADTRMAKSIEALHKEMTTVRTGRASPSLVDRLHVDYYGTQTPLQSLAGISAPEARLIVIQPYDKNSIAAIEKAIQESDLGLTPSNDGTVIRLAIPQLTEDRRKDMVKLVHRKAEDARVSVRNVRRDELNHLRKLQEEGSVGKDELESEIAQMQKVTDRYIAQIDEIAKHKEADIMEV